MPPRLMVSVRSSRETLSNRHGNAVSRWKHADCQIDSAIMYMKIITRSWNWVGLSYTSFICIEGAKSMPRCRLEWDLDLNFSATPFFFLPSLSSRCAIWHGDQHGISRTCKCLPRDCHVCACIICSFALMLVGCRSPTGLRLAWIDWSNSLMHARQATTH